MQQGQVNPGTVKLHVNCAHARPNLCHGQQPSTWHVLLQLFTLMQAEGSCVTAEDLQLALLAYIHLTDPAAAHATLRKHDALAAAWTAQQQQPVFDAALELFGVVPKAAVLLIARDTCMHGVVGQLPHASMQVHDLVMAMPPHKRLSEAFTVSCTNMMAAAVEMSVIALHVCPCRGSTRDPLAICAENITLCSHVSLFTARLCRHG